MTTSSDRRPLVLRREVLTELSADEMAQIAGASVLPPIHLDTTAGCEETKGSRCSGCC